MAPTAVIVVVVLFLAATAEGQATRFQGAKYSRGRYEEPFDALYKMVNYKYDY
jgi:hypothetical protein